MVQHEVVSFTTIVAFVDSCIKWLSFKPWPGSLYCGIMLKDGAVVTVLASHQCGPGFEFPDLVVVWFEYFVGSHPSPETFFLCSQVFLSLQKSTLLNSI